MVGTLAVDGWAFTFGAARRGLAAAPPSPLLAVPKVTAPPSTASIPTSYYATWRHCLCTIQGYDTAIFHCLSRLIRPTLAHAPWEENPCFFPSFAPFINASPDRNVDFYSHLDLSVVWSQPNPNHRQLCSTVVNCTCSCHALFIRAV